MWFEPTPLAMTSDPAELLPPGDVQVFEGSSVTLNWNYRLMSRLAIGVMKFNGYGIVSFQADGSAGPVNTKFQKRFNVSSTFRKASLFIYNVTVADDKANGEFSCELIDSTATTWKRTIQVEVIGKLEGATNQERQYLRAPDWNFFNLSECCMCHLTGYGMCIFDCSFYHDVS